MAVNDVVEVQIRGNSKQFKKEMSEVDKTLKKSQENASKMGGAVSGLGSALGGALPPQAGAAVSALGNLLDVVIAGGPLALGIAGLVAGAGFLASSFIEAGEASKKAAEQLRSSIVAALSRAKSTAEGAAKALEDYGKTSTRIAIDETYRQQADINMATWKMDVMAREKGILVEIRKARLEATKEALEWTRKFSGGLKEGTIEFDNAVRKQATYLLSQKELSDGAKEYIENLKAQREATDALEAARESLRALQEKQEKDDGKKSAAAAGKSKAKRDAEAYAEQVKAGREMQRQWASLQTSTRETAANMDAVTTMLRDEQAKENAKAIAESFSAGADELMMQLDLLEEIDKRERETATNRAQFAARQLGWALDLATQEKQSQEEITKAVLNRIRQEAWAHGTTLAIRGAGELALGNAGAAVTIGSGVALMAIGTGAAFAASNISGSAPSGGASAPVATSAPTGSVGPGQAAATQETTINNYIFNGPAFGMAEDDTARTITRLNARGSRLEGRG